MSKSDYLRLKEDYDRQETQLEGQRKQIEQRQEEPLLMERAWVKGLLEHGKLTSLDRPTLAELVDRIELFEDGKVQISYKIAIPEGML